MATPRPNPPSAPSSARGPRMPTDRNLPMLPSGFVASTPTFIRALAPMDENRSGSVGLGISTSTRPSLLPRSSTRQSLTNDAPLIEFDVTTTLPSSSDGRATAELERKLRESRRESLELKSKLANEMGMLAKEGERYRGQLAKAEGESEKLKEDRDFLLSAHQQITQQLADLQKAHTQLQQSSETAISSLRREAEKLKDELASAKSELALRTSEAVRKEAEWKSTQASLEGKLSAALQQADKAKESAQAKLKEMASVQSRVDDLERQLRDSRLSTSRAEDAEIVAKQLREQQPYIESLKAKLGQLGNENTGLRQRLENTEVLKDRISSLERDLLKKGDDKHRIEDLERELALLRAEKAQWAAFLPPAGSGGDSTPAGLAKKAYRAQLDLAVQKEKAGEVTSRLAAAEAELAETSIKLSTAQSRLRELELTSGKLEARTARAEKSKTLLVKEIELLKARCESYELELAETDGGRAAVDSTTEAKRWEAQAEGYRKRTEELEKELAEARAASGAPAPKQDAPVSADVVQRFQAQIRELESRLAEAKTEEKMLRKQCTALDDQVGLLERALGRGEYDPNTTKVLELRENPYSQSQAIRQEHLDRLCSENAALLAGLGKVASVPSASLKRAEFELEQAKKEVGEYVKRLDRLKKVFSEQASVVRESVGKLLGWKLDADPTNSRITLRSFYSAHESHCFYFKSAPGTSEHLKFLGSGSPEFLESLDPEVAYYLTKGGSLPGLLAWVTLEGFQRTTGALSMLPPDDGEGDGRKRRRG